MITSEDGYEIQQPGKLLCYTCSECGGQNWTIVRDEGVVMQRIACRRTNECRAICHFNPLFTDRVLWSELRPKPTYEWYRMLRSEAKRLDRKWEGTFQYWQKGGLGLRRIDVSN